MLPSIRAGACADPFQASHRWLAKLLLAGMVAVFGSLGALSADPAPPEPTPPRLTWVEPVGRWVPLHEEVAVRVDSSDGAPVEVRLDAGPAVLRDGRLTVTNRGTVTLSARHPTQQDAAPRLLRRHFNPSDIVIPRGTWPGYSRAEESWTTWCSSSAAMAD